MACCKTLTPREVLMAFDVDDNKKHKLPELWDYKDDDDAFDPRVRDRGLARINREKNRRTERNVTVRSRTQKNVRPGTVAAACIIALLLAACSVTAVSFYISEKKSQEISEPEVFHGNSYGDQSRTSLIAKMLPYPSGVTADRMEVLSSSAPYEITFYVKGMGRCERNDFLTTAIFAFAAIENLDIVNFTEEAADITYTFSRNTQPPSL